MKRKTKKARKRLCIIIAVCGVISVFAVYLIAGIIPPTSPDYADISISYDESDYQTTFDDYTDIELNGNTALCDSSGVSISKSNITIRASGAYRISGELTDGSIYIATADDGVVYLIFDNASVTCSTAPAVYISAASKVVFTTVVASNNTIATTVSGGLESAIYSDTDVTFNGKGTMSISSENGMRELYGGNQENHQKIVLSMEHVVKLVHIADFLP